MRKNLFLIGTLAFVLAFGMTVAGCDSGNNNGSSDDDWEGVRITNIPEEFNGKYAYLATGGETAGFLYCGAVSFTGNLVDGPNSDIKLAEIKDGTATLPLWVMNWGSENTTYTGTRNITATADDDPFVGVRILSTSTAQGWNDDNMLKYKAFPQIAITDGKAALDWDDGRD